MNPEVMLSVQQLCKHYPLVRKGFFSRQVGLLKACDDISFEVKRGETLGIVGESGSGKTTLGRAILRATRPTSGRVLFNHRAARHGAAEPGDRARAPHPVLNPLPRPLRLGRSAACCSSLSRKSSESSIVTSFE